MLLDKRYFAVARDSLQSSGEFARCPLRLHGFSLGFLSLFQQSERHAREVNWDLSVVRRYDWALLFFCLCGSSLNGSLHLPSMAARLGNPDDRRIACKYWWHWEMKLKNPNVKHAVFPRELKCSCSLRIERIVVSFYDGYN